VQGAQITLDEFFDHWHKTSVKAKVRQSMYRNYSGLVRRYIRPAIGKILLTSLVPLEIQTAYQNMTDRQLSARTVRYTHAVLRAAMGQAIRWQLLNNTLREGLNFPDSNKKKCVR
jgi:integrase